jgi:acetolactate synthase-1/3 small subunit
MPEVETAPDLRPAQHVVTALVQNETGTINRVVSLFRRRGFSLASFNAGDCEQPGFSRMTFLVKGDEVVLDQCLRQLEKLLDVVECQDLGPAQSVLRELAMIRVEPKPEDREFVYKVAQDFYAKTPVANQRTVVVEHTASPEEIDRLVTALRPYAIAEVVRTGVVALEVTY